jgi:TM2 domain-containing membrane protein YozV
MDEPPARSDIPPLAPRARSPYAAALLGWFVPGLGQAYTGRGAKGALFFVAVVGTFFLGWILTDYSAVDPQDYPLDFAAEVLAGGPTLVAYESSRTHVLDHRPRWLDVGRLYVLVAGLLNLVAAADAVGEAIARTRQALACEEEKRRRAERRAREEAEAATREPAEPPGGDGPFLPGAAIPEGSEDAGAPAGPSDDSGDGDRSHPWEAAPDR